MPAAPFSVDSFSATFTGVHLPIGLDVQSITFFGKGLEISTHPIEVSASEQATFEAVVEESAIVRFLTAKAPGGLKEFEVKLEGGEVHVKAVLKVIVELRASAVCRLVIKDKRQLFVELQSADVLAVGAKSLIKGQIDQVNPIFDVDQLPVPAQLDTVTIEDGLVRLTGVVSPPVREPSE